jgi:hypothetical protein
MRKISEQYFSDRRAFDTASALDFPGSQKQYENSNRTLR